MYSNVVFIDTAEHGEVYSDERGEFISSPIKYSDDFDNA